jgi:hypothetical protein
MTIAIVLARSDLKLSCRICDRLIDSLCMFPCLFQKRHAFRNRIRESFVRQIRAMSFRRRSRMLVASLQNESKSL